MVPMAARKKTRNGNEKKPPRYPSRAAVKYVGIPKEFWDILEAMGAPDDRSVAWMARKAIREYLERNGQLPKKQPPDKS
jgi:hypothetical protein